jgi:hypothetical protein
MCEETANNEIEKLEHEEAIARALRDEEERHKQNVMDYGMYVE